MAELVTFRLFLAIASGKSWHIHQLDINSAFLHGHLGEEIYITSPEGYFKVKEGEVYRLKCSSCGLKRAS